MIVSPSVKFDVGSGLLSRYHAVKFHVSPASTTSGGLKGQRELISLAVMAAFVLPSVIAYLLALRARRRQRDEPERPPGRH